MDGQGTDYVSPGLTKTAEAPYPVVLLLGQTGGGKSSIGNCVVGKEGVFQEGARLSSMTATCQVEVGRWFGKGEGVVVIDTPGFLDSERRDSSFLYGITEFMKNFPRGKLRLVVVALPLMETRANSTYPDMLETIELLLGNNAWGNVVFVTTHENQLNKETARPKEKIEGWLSWLRSHVKGHRINHCNFLYNDWSSLAPLAELFASLKSFTPQTSERIDAYLASNPSATIKEIIENVEATQALRGKYLSDIQHLKEEQEKLLKMQQELAGDSAKAQGMLERNLAEIQQLNSRIEALQTLPPPVQSSEPTVIHHGEPSGGTDVVGIIREVAPIATALISASSCSVM